MASDTVADLPVRFTWEQSAGPPGVTMVAHLDLNRLHFETRQDRRGQRLTLVGVLLDSHGRFVTGKRSELDLNLSDAVRGVAQDALDGKLTAASGAVEIKAPVEPPPEALPPK